MQITGADAGCWVPGSAGWKGSIEVIKLAQEFGMQVEDYDEDTEWIFELADEAEAWMNNNIAPLGYAFGWHDGEWFLWSHEQWEEEY